MSTTLFITGFFHNKALAVTIRSKNNNNNKKCSFNCCWAQNKISNKITLNGKSGNQKSKKNMNAASSRIKNSIKLQNGRHIILFRKTNEKKIEKKTHTTSTGAHIHTLFGTHRERIQHARTTKRAEISSRGNKKILSCHIIIIIFFSLFSLNNYGCANQSTIADRIE